MFCGGEVNIKQKEITEVYLNVYDISLSLNRTFGLMGLGIFHTGVEVYGEEYGFGRSTDGTGVYRLTPTTYDGHVFRESIFLGITNHSQEQVNIIISSMCYTSWYGSGKYNLINMNCNDFSEDLCHKLLDGNSNFPLWINRPCRMAAYLLPEIITKKIDSFDELVFLKYASRDALDDAG